MFRHGGSIAKPRPAPGLAAGIAHFNAGRFQEALPFFQAGARRSESARLFEAHCLAGLGRGEEARAVLSGLLEDRPGHPGALAALEGLKRRARRRPTAPPPRRERKRPARALVRAPRPAPALAAAAEPQGTPLRPVDTLQLPARLAEVELQNGRPDRAREAWESLLALSGGAADSEVRLERYRALARLGRFREAFREAEAVLDDPAASDEQKERLLNPWPAVGSLLGADRRASEGAAAELRELKGDPACGPWPAFFLYSLLSSATEVAAEIEGIRLHAEPRYEPMWLFLAREELLGGRFDAAAAAAGVARRQWRAHAYAAEALLCAGRGEDALARMASARALARDFERGEALAWTGELLLWAGRWPEAVEALDAALALGAPYALCWRGAARYLLGDRAAALKDLDEGLERYPRDLEAYAWRGEILRLEGRLDEALRDLHVEPLRESFQGRLSMPAAGPVPAEWSWHLINRALVRGAQGDAAGLKADAALLPPELAASGAAGLERRLRAAGGCRRPERYTWRLFLEKPKA